MNLDRRVEVMAQMNQSNRELLKDLKTLSSFSASQLEQLAENLSLKTYEKNEVIFEQNGKQRSFI
jgi:hypothetical protein